MKTVQTLDAKPSVSTIAIRSKARKALLTKCNKWNTVDKLETGLKSLTVKTYAAPLTNDELTIQYSQTGYRKLPTKKGSSMVDWKKAFSSQGVSRPTVSRTVEARDTLTKQGDYVGGTKEETSITGTVFKHTIRGTGTKTKLGNVRTANPFDASVNLLALMVCDKLSKGGNWRVDEMKADSLTEAKSAIGYWLATEESEFVSVLSDRTLTAKERVSSIRELNTDSFRSLYRFAMRETEKALRKMKSGNNETETAYMTLGDLYFESDSIQDTRLDARDKITMVENRCAELLTIVWEKKDVASNNRTRGLCNVVESLIQDSYSYALASISGGSYTFKEGLTFTEGRTSRVVNVKTGTLDASKPSLKTRKANGTHERTGKLVSVSKLENEGEMKGIRSNGKKSRLVSNYQIHNGTVISRDALAQRWKAIASLLGIERTDRKGSTGGTSLACELREAMARSTVCL